MIENFPLGQQQTEWSCLPTAVLCVLEYWGCSDISMDQVADWCQVLSGGACRWDDSMVSLRISLQEERGEYEVISLEGEWDAIREAVMENDEPIIVTIANPNPLVELLGSHAVVITEFTTGQDTEERVTYMDPATGTYASKSLSEFQAWWNLPGECAMLLRP